MKRQPTIRLDSPYYRNPTENVLAKLALAIPGALSSQLTVWQHHRLAFHHIGSRQVN